jgi:hypothetical protein
MEAGGCVVWLRVGGRGGVPLELGKTVDLLIKEAARHSRSGFAVGRVQCALSKKDLAQETLVPVLGTLEDSVYGDVVSGSFCPRFGLEDGMQVRKVGTCAVKRGKLGRLRPKNQTPALTQPRNSRTA